MGSRQDTSVTQFGVIIISFATVRALIRDEEMWDLDTRNLRPNLAKLIFRGNVHRPVGIEETLCRECIVYCR